MVKKIPKNASPELREKIINIRRKAFTDLNAIRNEKADEIVMTLDLFGGALTLNDILDTDISIIKSLELAKRRLIIRAREEREQRELANKTNSKLPKKTNAIHAAKTAHNMRAKK